MLRRLAFAFALMCSVPALPASAFFGHTKPTSAPVTTSETWHGALRQFTSESAAQARPADTVVWLTTNSGIYHERACGTTATRRTARTSADAKRTARAIATRRTASKTAHPAFARLRDARSIARSEVRLMTMFESGSARPLDARETVRGESRARALIDGVRRALCTRHGNAARAGEDMQLALARISSRTSRVARTPMRSDVHNTSRRA